VTHKFEKRGSKHMRLFDRDYQKLSLMQKRRLAGIASLKMSAERKSWAESVVAKTGILHFVH